MNLELTQRAIEALHDLLAYGRVDVDGVLKSVENRLRAEIETNRHTPACLAARSAQRRERQTYCRAWPNHCWKCHGEGLATWRENAAPHGSGESWPMENIEPCEHCIGQGICPRCGSDDNNFAEDDSDGGNMKCNSCGWKEGDAGCPEVTDDCGCFEDNFDEINY